jgi:hypothetical protein
MPNVDTWLIAEKDKPRKVPGIYNIRRRFVSGTAIAQNDVVRLFQIPRYHRVIYCSLYHGGTLGASATAQLRRNTTALTAATTQGGASFVAQSVPDTASTADGTDYLNILVAGAAAGTSATVTVEVILESTTRAEFES